MRNKVRILGIDPGLASVGYGILDRENDRESTVDWGCIHTGKDTAFEYRIKEIYDSINALITQYKPDIIAVEEIFFSKNTKTAIQVGHTRGVIILAAVNSGIEVREYTPLQVKQCVVGYGQADKRQVQEMMKRLLNLAEIPKPDDAADALAIAFCQAKSMKLTEVLENIL